MTLRQALSQVKELLSSVEDASLEAELLLRHVLGINRVQFYLDLEQKLSPEQEETFRHLVERRLRGEPSAYITGHREFYGFDFYVDPRVLIPRPESELLVEKAINLARTSDISSIADIGTGSGAIAISLALNLPPGIKIDATDISAPALDVALLNCRKHGVEKRIRLLPGDMLDPLPGPVDLIVANLPYVKASELAQSRPLSFEPLLALDGNSDGLEKIYKLCHQANGKLNLGGGLLLEVGQGQAEPVTALLRRLFPLAVIDVAKDLGGIARVVSLTLDV